MKKLLSLALLLGLGTAAVAQTLIIGGTGGGGGGSGTVTDVSVVTANGLAGTVATSTTTPAITLSTSVTGNVCGNGTALSACTATGTGNTVLQTSPTLTTPNIGTPSAGVLTNATGLPITTGVSGLGADVATFLATPSSANLATAVTGETGSGALVFATSPILVTPVLGAATATSIQTTGCGAGGVGSTICAGNTNIAIDSFAFSQSTGHMTMWTSAQVGWNTTATASGSANDTILTRAAAATVQHGAANAASPVAQIVKAQGSRPGTDSDVGGANFTFQSGGGTGTGTLSRINLQSPIAVASGSGAQTQTTGLAIHNGTAVSTGYTVATLPAAPLAGARAHVTDQLTACAAIGVALTGGGAITCPVFYNGAAWVSG